jgi:excisionase family DNA binding protein
VATAGNPPNPAPVAGKRSGSGPGLETRELPVREDLQEDLLRPREVAAIFGVRTSTLARWARDGRLTPLRTPGGHRRYSRAAVRDVLAADAEPDRSQEQMGPGQDRGLSLQ